MIDVTFLLLIYFLVTMVMTAQEDRLDSTLQMEQTQAAGSTDDFEPQLIEVLVLDEAPAYRLGGRVMRDRASLRQAIGGLPTSVPVRLRVHGGVPVAFALAARQVVHDAGFDGATYVPVAP